MNRRKMLGVIIGSLLTVGSVNRAGAYPVTWEFAGAITFVSDENDFLGGAVTVGSAFSGSYTFESTTPDGSPDDPTRGTYSDAITTLSGQVGTVSFFGAVGTVNRLTIFDDLSISDSDQYGISVDIELLGKTVVFRWILFDATASVFSDDSLPLSPPDLGSFYTRRLDIFSESETNPFFLSGQLTSLVPEPGMLLLLGVGALALAKRGYTRSGKTVP